MINKDFSDLENDPETKTLKRTISTINEIPCLHEFWSWDGIHGESLVFYKEDVLTLTDEEILKLVFKEENLDDKKQTIKRTDKFVFINYNFKI